MPFSCLSSISTSEDVLHSSSMLLKKFPALPARTHVTGCHTGNVFDTMQHTQNMHKTCTKVRKQCGCFFSSSQPVTCPKAKGRVVVSVEACIWRLLSSSESSRSPSPITHCTRLEIRESKIRFFSQELKEKMRSPNESKERAYIECLLKTLATFVCNTPVTKPTASCGTFNIVRSSSSYSCTIAKQCLWTPVVMASWALLGNIDRTSSLRHDALAIPFAKPTGYSSNEGHFAS